MKAITKLTTLNMHFKVLNKANTMWHVPCTNVPCANVPCTNVPCTNVPCYYVPDGRNSNYIRKFVTEYLETHPTIKLEDNREDIISDWEAGIIDAIYVST